jgi:WD40 repeat protein
MTRGTQHRFDTNDALYDLAWSEINENQLIAAGGDGSLKLFDLGVDEFPVMNFHEHKRETFAVAWNPVSKDTFLSSSWDGTVKIVSRQAQLISSLQCKKTPQLTDAVVTDARALPQDAPHRQLHLQRRLLPLEPGPDIRRLVRLAPPRL